MPIPQALTLALTAAVLIFALPLSAAPSASVAVVPYANRTGSAEYEWVKKSLPDAVYGSMQATFEFTRTDQQKIDATIAGIGAAGFVPDRKHLALVAEKTSSDIVISGWYTYDRTKNIIIVTTHVYHTSRGSITSQIQNDTPINNRMFQVIDVVAGKIVDHIKTVASEDIERYNRVAAEGKKIDATSQGKLVLKRASELSTLKDINMSASVSAVLPVGPLFDLVAAGFDIKFTVSSSYRSLFVWGGSVTFMQLFPPEKSLIGAPGFSSFDLQMFAALNFKVSESLFIQPYIAAGGAVQLFSFKVFITGLTKNFPVNYQYEFDFLISAGLRFPIKLSGSSNMIIPYAAFTWYPLHVQLGQLYLVAHVQAGVGIGF